MLSSKELKENIEIIEELSSAKPVVQKVLESHPSMLVLPESYKLHNIEHLLPQPIAFRGEYETNHIHDFCDYANHHKQPTTECFISPTKMQAKLSFTLGDNDKPMHRHHNSRLVLQKKSEFQALLEANGNKKSQDDLAYWLQDWQHQIIVKNEKDEKIELKDAIKSIRKMKIEEKKDTESNVQTHRSEMSELESIQVSTEGEPPHEIEFSCVPYANLPERIFTARLKVISSPRNIGLVFRIINLETEEEEMLNDFKEILNEKMPKEIKTRIGTFSE